MEEHSWTVSVTLGIKRNEKKINIFCALFTDALSHRLRFHENKFLSTTQKRQRVVTYWIESWDSLSRFAKWNFHFFCGIFNSLLIVRLHCDFWICEWMKPYEQIIEKISKSGKTKFNHRDLTSEVKIKLRLTLQWHRMGWLNQCIFIAS